MGEVDPAFIQDLEHRPKPQTLEIDDIPSIDLSPLESSNPAAFQTLVAQIGDACENWGFFQVINHGVPLHFRRKIELVSKEFFALSKEEKKKVGRDEVKPTGYYDTEHTKNVRDWKEVFDFTVEEPMIIPASHEPHDEEVKQIWNQWPQNFPEMK